MEIRKFFGLTRKKRNASFTFDERDDDLDAYSPDANRRLQLAAKDPISDSQFYPNFLKTKLGQLADRLGHERFNALLSLADPSLEQTIRSL